MGYVEGSAEGINYREVSMLCFRSLILLSLTTAALGCAPGRIDRLYDGEPLPHDAVTMIRCAPEVEITSIRKDGEEFDLPMITSGGLNAHLMPGRYEVEARYRSTWQITADQFEIVRSEKQPFVVNGQPGKLYRFNIERPVTFVAAKKFAKHPQITVTEELAPVVLPDEKMETIFYEEKPAESAKASAAPSVATNENLGKSESKSDSEMSPALRLLWKQASPKERAEFLSWADGQQVKR